MPTNIPTYRRDPAKATFWLSVQPSMLTLAGTGGGWCNPLGFSENNSRTDRPIGAKLSTYRCLSIELFYIFSENIKTVPAMTFDLWPNLQGHVKRNVHSVPFQRLKLANFGIFAGDMDKGSVLGPLLFLVYIDSVASQLQSEYKIFADDLKLYTCVRQAPGTTPVSSTALVQKDIDTLQTTAASWCLKMNPKKCVVLRFARPRAEFSPPEYFLDGEQIPYVDTHGDLGVTVDSQLKFHDHVRTVVRKAGGLAQNFLKSTVCRSPEFMLFLLTAHIRPIIEYCSCLWNTGYVQDLRALEKVQRRWTKQIDGMHDLSYADRLRSLNLYSVQGRLVRADLLQCWKMFHGKSCISPDELFDRPPQDRTRGHCYIIFSTFTHTDIRKRFFSVRCVPIWNSLPADVVCAHSLNKFKGLLEVHAHDRLFAYVWVCSYLSKELFVICGYFFLVV